MPEQVKRPNPWGKMMLMILGVCRKERQLYVAGRSNLASRFKNFSAW
jgi:hypothetical protein